MKILVDVSIHDVDDYFTARTARAVERIAQIHNAVFTREAAIQAILEITERPDEVGEAMAWVTLADGYIPLRYFIVDGHTSKWQSAENWERNPWFP